MTDKEVGIKIEHEHLPTLEKTVQYIDINKKAPDIVTFATWIYEDHVKEYPEYYNNDTGLPSMERTLEGETK